MEQQFITVLLDFGHLSLRWEVFGLLFSQSSRVLKSAINMPAASESPGNLLDEFPQLSHTSLFWMVGCSIHNRDLTTEHRTIYLGYVKESR